jgi:hypothetical protein
MKKKITFLATFIIALLGVAFAHSTKFPATLYIKLLVSPFTCVQADATNFNTGYVQLPPNNYQGYYLNETCTSSKVTGYVTTYQ